MKRQIYKALSLTLLFAVIGLTMPDDRCVTAGEPLRAALSDVAVQIKKVLELEDTDTVALGLIVPANGDAVASYGRRVAEFLRLELLEQRVATPQKANLRLKGEYILDPASGTIRISVTIVDKLGKTVAAIETGAIRSEQLETEVKDSSELVLVAHASVAIAPSEPLQELSQKLADLQQNQSDGLSIADGYLTLPSLGLGIRLREVHPELKSNDPRFAGSIIPATSITPPHFSLQQGSSYVVETKSTRTDIDFALKVLFDGIDTFVLSDATESRVDMLQGGRSVPKYEFWTLMRGGTQSIPGWFKNLRQVSAFQAAPDENSVAFRLGAPQGIGTIQVIAQAAWPKGGEVSAQFRKPRSKGGMAEGKTIEVNLKPLEIETGVVLGAISAQYEVQ